MASDVRIGLLDGINEAERCLLNVFAEVAGNRVINVPVGQLTRNDWLGRHPLRAVLGRLPHPITQPLEVGRIGRGCRSGRRAREQESTQLQAILILADQFTHVLAARAVAALIDLLIDEGLERVREGDVHCTHGSRSVGLAKFGKIDASCLTNHGE